MGAMKDLHQKHLEEQVKERSKATRQSFEMADQKEKYEDIVQKLKSDLKATNEALLAQSAEPKIKELEAQLEEHKKNTLVLLKEKTDLTAATSPIIDVFCLSFTIRHFQHMSNQFTVVYLSALQIASCFSFFFCQREKSIFLCP